MVFGFESNTMSIPAPLRFGASWTISAWTCCAPFDYPLRDPGCLGVDRCTSSIRCPVVWRSHRRGVVPLEKFRRSYSARERSTLTDTEDFSISSNHHSARAPTCRQSRRLTPPCTDLRIRRPVLALGTSSIRQPRPKRFYGTQFRWSVSQ